MWGILRGDGLDKERGGRGGGKAGRRVYRGVGGRSIARRGKEGRYKKAICRPVERGGAVGRNDRDLGGRFTLGLQQKSVISRGREVDVETGRG